MSEDVVYVIIGAAGSYSDAREWPVRVFLDEDEAKRYEALLDDYIKQRPSGGKYIKGKAWSISPEWQAWENGCPYDDSFASGADDGISYSIATVPCGWPTEVLEIEKKRAEEAARRKAETKTRAIMLDD